MHPERSVRVRAIFAIAFATCSGTTEVVLYDAGDIFTFAISPNGRFVYVTFSVDTLETYRAERESHDDPFSAFEPAPELSLDDPDLIGFAVTGVTDDDCEVYGWTYDLSGTDSIWRAVRGGPQSTLSRTSLALVAVLQSVHAAAYARESASSPNARRRSRRSGAISFSISLPAAGTHAHARSTIHAQCARDASTLGMRTPGRSLVLV